MPEPDFTEAVAEHSRGSVLSLTVVPRSATNGVLIQEDGSLRVRIAAPPVDGAANAALLKFLAKALDVPRSRLTLISGESGRRKRILVEGITGIELGTRLRASVNQTR